GRRVPLRFTLAPGYHISRLRRWCFQLHAYGAGVFNCTPSALAPAYRSGKPSRHLRWTLGAHAQRDSVDDSFRVSTNAHQRRGRHRVKKIQTNKIDSGNFPDNSELVNRVAVFVEDR